MTTSIHMFRTDKLREDFQIIIEITKEITKKKDQILEKLHLLREIYNDLVKKNNKKIFLFCLDSFFFQYKTLNMEMDNITRYTHLMSNRMYGEYYKLFNIIAIETGDTYPEIRAIANNVSKKYPAYKDLDPFHEYSSDATAGLHDEILQAIDCLFRHFAGKEQNIHGYSDNSRIGISIVNFIHTLEYENTLLREQISLYINYISFFHTSQSGYLKKLYIKVQNFQMEIEDEIMLNYQNVRPLQNANSADAPVDMTAFFTIDNPLVDTVIGTFASTNEDSLASSEHILNHLDHVCDIVNDQLILDDDAAAAVPVDDNITISLDNTDDP